MSQKHVTARIPEEMYEAIERIRDAEHTDRSTAIKVLLERGIDQWRLDEAVDRYRDGRATIGAAAEQAGVSLWQFIDVLDERGVAGNYTAEDLEADLDAVRQE